MEAIKVTLRWDKETPGTHRYAAAEGRDGLIPTLYLPKRVLGAGTRPDAITVTVEAAD
jgi:hypothetical protein